MNATMKKFGYPETLLEEYEHWAVVLRPAQVTLGSLVLVCKEEATAFASLSRHAFEELQTVIRAIESTLGARFTYDRINYLMLMMVDPDVHLHVIPRYQNPVEFMSFTFTDATWPGPPDITHKLAVPAAVFEALKAELAECWERG